MDDLIEIPQHNKKKLHRIPVMRIRSTKIEKSFAKKKFPKRWIESRSNCIKDLWKDLEDLDQGQLFQKRGLGYRSPWHSCHMVEILALDEEEDDEDFIEPAEAPPEFELGNQPTKDELVEVDISTDGKPRPTFISSRI
ncbi:hypothetical protein L8N14_015190 [Serratia marcescens]|nr:hypothetical protein [Serratia marcescens]